MAPRALALVASALFLGPLGANSMKLQSGHDEQLRLHKLHNGDPEALEAYTFQKFMEDYQRTYAPGSIVYKEREALFHANKADILKFQALPGRSYDKGANSFLDWTKSEYKALLGYKGRRRNKGQAHAATLASLERETDTDDEFLLPSKFEFPVADTGLADVVRDQGGCGSCWAVAATSVLELQMAANASVLKSMKAALKKKTTNSEQAATLSSQAVVSCTPNERHCGGTGGCDGATAELAYEMIKDRGGLPLAADWSYESGWGSQPACKDKVFQEPRLAITGYTVLPNNKQGPLLKALVQTAAPIAVSVAANGWMSYGGGLFTTDDVTVNHAVVFTGFQMPGTGSDGYYKIRNSWGQSWGEQGHIRITMYRDDESRCAMDHAAHDGIACDGDPDDTWVCGTSGVLYDSVFPTGLHFKQGTGEMTADQLRKKH